MTIFTLARLIYKLEYVPIHTSLIRKLILFIVLFVSLPYSFFGQENCEIDTDPPFCLIQSYTLEGQFTHGGTMVYFAPVGADLCSEIFVIESYLVNEGKPLHSGDTLSCGKHPVQSIVTDESANLIVCEYIIYVSCDDADVNNPIKDQNLSKTNSQGNDFNSPLLDPTENFSLGSLSAIWESGGRGPGTISKGGADPGGVSYGIYQLSMKQGYISDFLKHEGVKYKKRLLAYSPGTKKFNNEWKKIARSDPSGFHKAQHDFIERTHFNTYVKRIYSQLNMDIKLYSKVLQDVVWSTAVQHGPYNNIFNNALKEENLSELSEREIIRKIYAERARRYNGKLVNFPRVKFNWQQNLIQRFESELQVALSRLDNYELYLIRKNNSDSKDIASETASVEPIPELAPKAEGNKVSNILSKSSESTDQAIADNSSTIEEEYKSTATSNDFQHDRQIPGEELEFTTKGSEINPEKDVTRTNEHSDSSKSIAPKNKVSVSFKILFTILDNENYTFSELTEIGKIWVEKIGDLNMYRFLVSESSTLEAALEMQKIIKSKGYKAAQIARYENNKYIKIVSKP